jgi:hypothetical protein
VTIVIPAALASGNANVFLANVASATRFALIVATTVNASTWMMMSRAPRLERRSKS